MQSYTFSNCLKLQNIEILICKFFHLTFRNINCNALNYSNISYTSIVVSAFLLFKWLYCSMRSFIGSYIIDI